MSTLFLPALCVGQISRELLELDAAFVGRMERSLSRGSILGYQKTPYGPTVVVSATVLENGNYDNSSWRRWVSNPSTIRLFGLSGLPLGDTSSNQDSSSTLRVAAILDCVRVDVRLQYGLRNGRLEKPNYSTDKEYVEGSVRNVLARIVGQELSPSGNVNVSGRAITGMMTRDGTRMAPLSGWANARGFNLTYNRRLGTCSFTANGRQIIVPLSAKQIKVGASWKDLGAPILRKNDEWYIPLDAFQREV